MWSRSRRFTEAELSVIDCLLSGDDERLLKLRQQVRQATGVKRSVIADGHGYRVEMDATFDDLLIPLDVDVWSESCTAADAKSKKKLTFRVRLFRGGFFGFLEGETCDATEWPKRFEPSLDEETQSKQYVTFPLSNSSRDSQAAMNWLSEWLEIPLERLKAVQPDLRVPATPAAIQAAEEREGIELASDMVALLSASDGIDIGDFGLLGTADLYTIQDRTTDEKLLVVALVDPDGLVVAPLHGGTPFKLLSLAKPDLSSAIHLGDTFTEFLKTSIAMKGKAPEPDATQ
jgi:hypothetical protein